MHHFASDGIEHYVAAMPVSQTEDVANHRHDSGGIHKLSTSFIPTTILYLENILQEQMDLLLGSRGKVCVC
jgi:hypothetical protein